MVQSETNKVNDSNHKKEPQDRSQNLIKAKRAAFLARFIVLRESKRSRAHRNIELLEWDDCTTAEDLAFRFREEFQNNGDLMTSVDRDLRRALNHSRKTIHFFINEYSRRATTNFIEALADYELSISLLFGEDDEQPKTGGWRLPVELRKLKGK